MSEKRFLNFILFEGIILTILSLSILILPKLTNVTFGVMLSAGFITYGLYKILTSFFNKNYISSFISKQVIDCEGEFEVSYIVS